MSDNQLNPLPEQDEKEAHLLDYLHVVQRRWKIALVVLLLVFAAVAIKTFLATPVYQATVTLRIGLKPDTSQEVLEKRKERYYSMESELQVLRSFKVAERAAKLLQLNWHPRDAAQESVLQIRRLIVQDDVDVVKLQALEGGRFKLFTDSSVLLEDGRSGIPFAEEIEGLIELAAAKPGDIYELVRITSDQAAGMVSQGVSAYPMGDLTSMIGLSVERTDPKTARDVANAIAMAYANQDREQKLNEAATILDMIDQQLAALGAQLNVSEQNLQKFKIQTGLQRLSPEGASMIDVAVALEKQRTELLLQRQKIEEFSKDPGYSALEPSMVESLPGVPELLTRLLELRGIRGELLREYTPSHPDVIDVEGKIDLLKDEIANAAVVAIKSLDEEIAAIDAELEISSKKLEQVPEEELELARLSRASSVNAELYSYLLQRQQEERIAQASITSKVEIVNEAQLPLSPIKPNKKKALGLGALIGLLLGVGLTFLLEYLDQTIKDEDEIKEKFGLTVLGTIPQISDANGSDKRQLVTHLEPHSIPAEAFLALRTNIHFILTNNKHKTLMLTSCLPDEGKSTVAVNLAATMAQTGAKILLVGCDLRRPSLYTALGQSETPGLSDMLAKGSKSALRRLDALGFDFIPGGTEPPNPTQLLSSDAMKRFLDAAKQQYDFVILDVPPLIPIADALILSSLVDLSLLVLEPCRIPDKLLERAIHLLHNHEAEIAGVVINDKTGKGSKYYGGYNYYNSKYYEGYYRRATDGPKPPFLTRVIAKVWRFING